MINNKNKQSIPKHVLFKLQKNKDRGKILRKAERKIYFTWSMITIIMNFYGEIIQAKRE